MSEIRLQSDITRRFSELFPLKRGQLFHVSNERNNQIQVFQARAIGVFPGVCDFLFIDKTPEIKGYLTSSTILVGIEVKEPGSYHKREHIEQQIEWAEILEANGGTWRLCRSVEEAISCTQLNFKGLTIENVKELLKSTKNKNIRF